MENPVCAMDVDPAPTQQKAKYQGDTYYLCGPGCRKTFETDPAKFLDPAYKSSMRTQ